MYPFIPNNSLVVVGRMEEIRENGWRIRAHENLFEPWNNLLNIRNALIMIQIGTTRYDKKILRKYNLENHYVVFINSPSMKYPAITRKEDAI